MKKTLYVNDTTDIILSGLTDFSAILPRLEELGIFDRIIVSDDSTEDNRIFSNMSIDEKCDVLRCPTKIVHKLQGIRDNYTDYYSYSMVVYGQLIYYMLLSLGMRPNVHIYEEGLYNYVEDAAEREEINNIALKIYGKKAFVNCIVDQWLYCPSLFSANRPIWEIKEIPQINTENKKITDLFYSLWPVEEVPKERFIFLEEAFVWDRIDARDIACLDEFAEIVGKDNIIVKLHPRNPIDRFTKRGYKVMGNSKIPWEIYSLNKEIDDKVFVTISSNASVTANEIFGKRVNVIQLYKAIGYGKNNAQKKKNYNSFLLKLEEKYNENGVYLFLPKNQEEMREVVKYIDGRNRSIFK